MPPVTSFNFAVPANTRQASALLKLPPASLDAWTAETRSSFYTPRNVGGRDVLVADSPLAQAQRSVCRKLNTYLTATRSGWPHAAVFGFRPGGSTRSNAEVHRGYRCLLCVDIERFFPSISVAAVQEALGVAGLQPQFAELLARFFTTPEGLPTGAPSSPLVSNLVFLPLDLELEQYATQCAARYTRYADDLSFSTEVGFALPCSNRVGEILEPHGFVLNPAKTKRTKPGQAHFVTGLSVALEDRVTAPKKLKRKVRHRLHSIGEFGLEKTAEHFEADPVRFVAQLDGWIGYLSGVDPIAGQRAQERWKEVVEKWSITISRRTRTSDLKHYDVALFVDESQPEKTGLLSLCVAEFTESRKSALSEQLEDHREALRWLANREYLDPHSTQRKKAHLAKNDAPHYTGDNEDLRTSVIRELCLMPFRAYIAYTEEGEYAQTYRRLFGDLLADRLRANTRARRILVAVEQNSKVDKFITRFVEETAGEVFGDRLRIESRHGDLAQYAGEDVTEPDRDDDECDDKDGVVYLAVHRVAKAQEPLVAVPDYVLGVILDTKENRNRGRAESLRDHVRYVHDVENCAHYNRTRPWPWPLVRSSATSPPSGVAKAPPTVT